MASPPSSSSTQKEPRHFEKGGSVFTSEYICSWAKQTLFFRIAFTLLSELLSLLYLPVYNCFHIFTLLYIFYCHWLLTLVLHKYTENKWAYVHSCYRFINSEARSTFCCFYTCIQFFSPSWKWAGLGFHYALDFCFATASGREFSAIDGVGKWRKDPHQRAGSVFRWWTYGPRRLNRWSPGFCTWN